MNSNFIKETATQFWVALIGAGSRLGSVWRFGLTLLIALTAMLGSSQTFDTSSVVIPYHSSLRREQANGASTLYSGEAYFKFVIYEGDPADSQTWEPIWSPNPDYMTSLDPARLIPVPEPTAFVKIQATNGVVSFGLGDSTSQLWQDVSSPLLKNSQPVYTSVLNPTHFLNGRFFLRVWLSEDGTLFERLDPDVALMGAPLALRAAIADRVAGGGVNKDALETNLRNLVTRMETLSGYMDQMALISDNANDSALTGEGFSVAQEFPADPWVEADVASPPSARLRASVVWTGTELLVWGGVTSNSGLKIGTGALFDPSAQSWRPINTINAPSARDGQAGVWTGSRFIVWGGNGNSGFLKDGALLDPSTNLWTSLPDLPPGFEARTQFAYCWTGSRLVIFGGRSLGGLLSDVWTLDPVAETWTELPAYPGDGTYLASAVWSNGKLVIWGGQTNTGASNAGYFYTPSPDWASGTWTAMSTSPLSARARVSAESSDSKVFIWGGVNGGSVFSDGALWDPTDNTWSAVASAGSNLVAAYDSASAWTGSEFFVFGGRTSSGVSGSGAFYDPIKDQWRPSQSNGPSGRHGVGASYSSADQSVWIFGGETVVGAGGVNEIWNLPTKKPLFIYKKTP
jgi:hypothetical protein